MTDTEYVNPEGVDSVDLIKFNRMLPEDYQSMQAEFNAKLPTEVKNISNILLHGSIAKNIHRNLAGIIDSMAHVGFDPIFLLSKFYKIAQEHLAVEGSWSIKDNAGKVILELTKATSLTQDLALFVILFITRGTNAKKILAKIDDQWIEPLTAKFNTYGISINPEKKSKLKRDTITIARLAGCVPNWVCFCYKMGFGREIVNLTRYTEYVGMELPRAMRNNSFIALIPTDIDHEDFLKYCYLFSLHLDFIINSSSTVSLKTRVEQIKGYADAAHKNTLMNNGIRKASGTRDSTPALRNRPKRRPLWLCTSSSPYASIITCRT